ncbi:MAG: 6,7-dimethyl-8-ribityllumazine synthase [Planctomycetes bacterium]|nr:6,7-dimethyl-8-ribityllumazine synthase [Planctomycetota bacterium]
MTRLHSQKSAPRRARRVVEGHFVGTGRRVAIVVARFNEIITRHLLEGCQGMLLRHGVSPEQIDVVWVPGSLEIPTAAREIARRKRADAIVCLGCVIRGETAHYDHVCRETARGVAEVGRRTGVPTIFGVLTVDTLEQAIERAGSKMGNKGAEAALAALEMADLLKRL